MNKKNTKNVFGKFLYTDDPASPGLVVRAQSSGDLN